MDAMSSVAAGCVLLWLGFAVAYVLLYALIDRGNG